MMMMMAQKYVVPQPQPWTYYSGLRLTSTLEVIAEPLYSTWCAENNPRRLTPGDYTPNCNPPDRNPQFMCIPRR